MREKSGKEQKRKESDAEGEKRFKKSKGSGDEGQVSKTRSLDFG